ncbi:oligosaccharide flippase family protein [Candidatus Daviesbacteria bacterium]|nr:oligosaccharide flippase family protein [Candidatus Daviesbacteria bacterium]
MQIPELNQEIPAIQKKVVNGVFILGLKRILTQLILTSSNIILSRVLFPADFGKFAVISFVLAIFTLTSDIGLTAALVQRRKKPSEDELKTIFTLQIILAVTSVVLIWLSTPFLLIFYKSGFDSTSAVMLKVAAFSILFFNLKLIPAVLLEREMRFARSVIAEVFELLIMQLTTVIFALKGFGFESFVFGLLVSRLAAVPIYYILHPFKIGFRLSLNELKTYLPFGMHVQFNSIIGTIGGMSVPVVVGGMLGVSQLGLVNWAGGVAVLPRAVGDVVGRIIFPMCARFQTDRRFLKKIIERALQLNNLASFPVIIMIIALAQPVTLIIFTDKWIGGISVLYLLTLQSAFMVPEVIFTTALLALGYSKTVRNINLMFTALIWFLSIPLVKILGLNGFALASLFASLIFLVSLRELRKHVKIAVVRYTLPYMFYAVSAGILVYVYSLVFPIRSLLELILSVVFGGLSYGFLLLLFERKELIKDMVQAYQILQKK